MALVACFAVAWAAGFQTGTRFLGPSSALASGGSAAHGRVWKVRTRRLLRREVARNPRSVLRRSFLRLAAAADFDLPLTVRLNEPGNVSDDHLQIAWNTDTQAWPLGAAYQPAPVVDTTLDGRFTMEWNMGADTSGYSTPGTNEVTLGAGVYLTAPPFAISDFDPLCAATPAVTAATRRVLTGSDPLGADVPGVSIESGGSRYGTFNPFIGTMQGGLNLYFKFRSVVRSGCGDAAGSTTRLFNPTPNGAGSVGAAPAVPVHFSGQFSISPAIMPDGALRFGKLVVDDAVEPQDSTFGQIFACSQRYGPLDNATCVPPAGAGPGDEAALAFPARVKVTHLTADVMVGNTN